MGRRSVGALLGRLDAPDAPAEHVVVAPELVVRASTTG
jgi:DNA-binding LacI/PurR family transcriptional regulator